MPLTGFCCKVLHGQGLHQRVSGRCWQVLRALLPRVNRLARVWEHGRLFSHAFAAACTFMPPHPWELSAFLPSMLWNAAPFAGQRLQLLPVQPLPVEGLPWVPALPRLRRCSWDARRCSMGALLLVMSDMSIWDFVSSWTHRKVKRRHDGFML